jgi:hypothetical protein
MWFLKPKGFFPPERHLKIEEASDFCMAIVSRIPVPFESEEHRQIGLSAFGDLVETALEESLPDNLNERTVFLEGVVGRMQKVRLSYVDRLVLMAIGNLLIDSGIRKGRRIDERIPQEEVLSLKGKAIQYTRYTVGKL